MQNGILPLVVLLLAAQASASRNQPAPPGSFLKYRAISVRQLTDQVSRDRSVAGRYAKHFGCSPASVVEYFRQNLRLTKLTKPVQVTAYGITKSGRIVGKRRVLPKGTPVFVGRHGEPVLKGGCGNPLRAGLPVVLAEMKRELELQPAAAKPRPKAKVSAALESLPKTEVAELPAAERKPGEEQPGEEIVTKILGAPGAEISPAPVETLPPEAAPSDALPPAVPSPLEPEMPSLVVQTPPSGPVTVPPPIVRERSFSLLPILPLIGIGAGFGGGGGTHNPPPPIPEPASWVALCGGVASLVGVRAIRRRK